MEFSNKSLNKLEELWLKDHPGKNITREELIVMAERLVHITRLVYRPIPE